MTYLKQLAKLETFIFDVDGVYTDGKVTLNEEGDMLRGMNIKDGYITKEAMAQGLNIIVISGGTSEAVRKRFEKLGVKMIFLGVEDKYELLHELILDGELEPRTSGYMGDDVPDLEAMKLVDFICCPQDAIQEIKDIAHYISPVDGGEGCVRDVLEKAIKLKELWSKPR